MYLEFYGLREAPFSITPDPRFVFLSERHRDAPILAYAPRPGLGVDAATRARLARLRVDYFDAPLNTSCAEYGSANRVFAAADAEHPASRQ